MSEWRAAINRKALARLDKALPAIFPRVVLIHALTRPPRFTPPLPRLAVDSYWRAHPVPIGSPARSLAAAARRPDGAGGFIPAGRRRIASRMPMITIRRANRRERVCGQPACCGAA
jgi:hypothetical protein